MAGKRVLVDPRTKYEYTLDGDGFVVVEDPATGKRGRFAQDARFVDGDLTYCNRQLLGWVARQHLVAKKRP